MSTSPLTRQGQIVFPSTNAAPPVRGQSCSGSSSSPPWGKAARGAQRHNAAVDNLIFKAAAFVNDTGTLCGAILCGRTSIEVRWTPSSNPWTGSPAHQHGI
jgi:hypothetical protein